MKYELSEETRKIAANYENEHEYAVVDAVSAEAKLHDGLHWLHVNDLANELWSAMMGADEVEGGSAIDELMAAVVILSYSQALKRAAKVLNVPYETLRDKEYELSDKEGF